MRRVSTPSIHPYGFDPELHSWLNIMILTSGHMGPVSVSNDSSLLFLVELKRLRLKTLTSPRPQHGRSESVSNSCLPINESSVAVEGYDSGWFQAILSPLFRSLSLSTSRRIIVRNFRCFPSLGNGNGF